MKPNDRILYAHRQRTLHTTQTDAAALIYKIDWALSMDEDDTIIESTWTDDSGLLTITSDEHTDTEASAVITGPEGTHTVKNQITTMDGSTDERSIVLHITTTDNYSQYWGL